MNFHEFCYQTGMNFPTFQVFKHKYLIYFLLRGSEIVYIGKTSNKRLPQRLQSHLKNKDFDSFAIMLAGADERSTLKAEAGFISLVKPEYNIDKVSTNFDDIHFALCCVKGKVAYVERETKSNWQVLADFEKRLMSPAGAKALAAMMAVCGTALLLFHLIVGIHIP